VLHSSDGGRSWTIASTGLAAGPSSGIFSIAFRDASHGVVVGGDYRKESDAIDNAATTADGGRTWTTATGLSGYRSAVAYVDGRTIIAVGPTGADYSADDGAHWSPVNGPGFHAFAMARGARVGWGVGEKGAIGRLSLGDCAPRSGRGRC
jgi:photosystem II stability/assembly factor-like uncharacterized protein